MPPAPHADPNNSYEEEQKTRSYDWRLLLKFGRFLKPFRFQIVCAAFLSVLSAGMHLIGPQFVRHILDGPVKEGDLDGINKFILIWLAVIAGEFMLNFSIRLLVTWTGQSAMLEMRHALFSHLQRMHQKFFDKNRVGRLLTRVMNDVGTLNELLSMGIPTFFRDVLMLLGVVVVLFMTDWRLASIMSICFPVIFAITWIFSRSIRVYYRQTRTRIAALNAYLQENLTGMSTVQLYAREERNYSCFKKLNGRLRDAHLGTVFAFALLFPAIEAVFALGVALILWHGGIRLRDGTITIGILTAFILYLKMFILPIRDLAEKFNMIEAAMASGERIFELLDTAPEILDPQTKKTVAPFKDGIRFEGVWFAYDEPEWILKDLNFSVKKGQTVAIVGATGAGKTSIINALLRLYDIQKGSIQIDGTDIRDMGQHDLRKKTGVVLQDAFLFNATILDNIRIGNPDLEEEAVRSIAKKVNADDFISNLEGRYHHTLLESGSTLSVGQKQLLAFARALACSPEILILDEATSNIDTETEALIQDALIHMIEDRTAIVIAHRLSTIRRADKILVMHKGKIREEGSHEELLKRDGIYRKLCEIQYNLK